MLLGVLGSPTGFGQGFRGIWWFSECFRGQSMFVLTYNIYIYIYIYIYIRRPLATETDRPRERKKERKKDRKIDREIER